MKMYLLHRKAFRFVAGKGLGMVAKRRILPGEIILEEAPLIILPDDIYAGKGQETVSLWWVASPYLLYRSQRLYSLLDQQRDVDIVFWARRFLLVRGYSPTDWTHNLSLRKLGQLWMPVRSPRKIIMLENWQNTFRRNSTTTSPC
jgi:hypothetical protein